MGFFGRLFGREQKAQAGDEDQAIIIILDGVSLPDQVYAEHDSSTLEELLEEALGELGECDGAEHGEQDTRIFLYGPDAEAMFRAVEPTLIAYPLAASAQVVLRFGPPGAPQRSIHLP